jgi:hypothetical protein
MELEFKDYYRLGLYLRFSAEHVQRFKLILAER